MVDTHPAPVVSIRDPEHGAHLGPTVSRWVPCWPHELCYLGISQRHFQNWVLNSRPFVSVSPFVCKWYAGAVYEAPLRNSSTNYFHSRLNCSFMRFVCISVANKCYFSWSFLSWNASMFYMNVSSTEQKDCHFAGGVLKLVFLNIISIWTQNPHPYCFRGKK